MNWEYRKEANGEVYHEDRFYGWSRQDVRNFLKRQAKQLESQGQAVSIRPTWLTYYGHGKTHIISFTRISN